MNPDAPFSANGVHKLVPKPEKKNVPALVIGLIAIPTLLLVVVPVVWTIAMSTGKPVFDNVEDLNLEEISRFEIQLYNLKSLVRFDRKDDDIGPYVAKPENYERLLGPFKSATVVEVLPAKAFLGEFRIQMKDGRRQVIRLSFIPEADGTKRLAFKIGLKAFRGGPVDELITIAEACDPRPKKN